jgi:D-inositol-3-phosphate glycosyltransferase
LTLLPVSIDGPRPRRVAMLSVHTSPLAQPGIGDAGGMNVYVLEVAKRLAASGVEVEMFTRATSSDQQPVEHVSEGLLVRNVLAGPYQQLHKEELPAQLCGVTAAVLRSEANRDPGWFDLVHSHYWLSGQVGWVTTARWDTPLVHSFHTLAKVKNRDRGDQDAAEPDVRVTGEQQVVAAADRLVANTSAEADDLIELYDADPLRVDIVHPGVDLDTFSPGDQVGARRHFGLDPRRPLVVFVGRLQPLKAPDLLLAAAGLLAAEGAPPQIVICGGPSGNGDGTPEALRTLAANLGIADSTRFLPPLPKPELATLYRAATVVAVPSYSESFGLVAVEAQACGTPVLAAAVGGLPTAVAADSSGLLIPDHRPESWAAALDSLLNEGQLRQRLAAGARSHAERFGWGATTADLLRTYARALAARTAPEQTRRGA